MNHLARALPCLLLTLLLVPLAHAAVTTAVRAPTFTFTGTFAVPVPDGATNATLALDTGQAAHATAGLLVVAGVPDGLRSWRLTFQDAAGLQDVAGEFTAQDLTQIVAKQIQRSVDASLDAKAAALRANATAALSLNVSLAAQDTARRVLEAVQAIHVPDDLSRRSDVESVGASVTAQGQAIAGVLQQQATNQSAALHDASRELRTLRDAGAFLVGLLLLGLGLLACYLARLRAEVRRLNTEAPPAPARASRPPPPPPAPAPALAGLADEPPRPPPSAPPRSASRSRQRGPPRRHALPRALTDPGGPDAD